MIQDTNSEERFSVKQILTNLVSAADQVENGETSFSI